MTVKFNFLLRKAAFKHQKFASVFDTCERLTVYFTAIIAHSQIAIIFLIDFSRIAVRLLVYLIFKISRLLPEHTSVCVAAPVSACSVGLGGDGFQRTAVDGATIFNLLLLRYF